MKTDNWKLTVELDDTRYEYNGKSEKVGNVLLCVSETHLDAALEILKTVEREMMSAKTQIMNQKVPTVSKEDCYIVVG